MNNLRQPLSCPRCGHAGLQVTVAEAPAVEAAKADCPACGHELTEEELRLVIEQMTSNAMDQRPSSGAG